MGAEELLLFSKALEPLPEDAIKRVCGRLSTTKREEYESKIPDLPDLLDMVHKEANKDNPWTPCGECGEGGHVVVEEEGRRFARRCGCWLAWKSRQQALQYPALQSARETR